MKIWKVNSLATWVGKKDHLCLVWHIRVTSWDLHNLESYEIQQLLGLTLLEVGAYVRCYVRVTFTTFDATTPIPSLLPPSGKSPSQANWTSGCPTPLCFYKSASIISLYIYIHRAWFSRGRPKFYIGCRHTTTHLWTWYWTKSKKLFLWDTRSLEWSWEEPHSRLFVYSGGVVIWWSSNIRANKW